MNIDDLLWPWARLGAGMEELARRAGLRPVSGEALVPPADIDDESMDLARWIDWAGSKLGLEAEEVETTVGDFRHFAAHAGPALIHFASKEGPAFLLLLNCTRGRLTLLSPSLCLRHCTVEALRHAMCWKYEAPLVREIDRLLALAALPAKSWAKVRDAMLLERLAAHTLGGCWVLRLAPATSFWRQLSQARVPLRLLEILAIFGLLYFLEIVGWGLIGDAALKGRFDIGWMTAWLLLMLSLIPVGVIGSWLNARFTLDVGRIMKRRLLAGALRLELDTVRHQGAGQLLSRVMESRALEGLALSGGLLVLTSCIELALAGWVLSLGVGRGVHALLLVCWLAITVVLSWRYITRVKRWTATRLDMTHRLVEHMVGHRTRLAQEWPARRNAEEDQMLNDYAQVSRQMDLAGVAVFAGVPGGWGVIGILGLAPAFIAGSTNPAGLAIGFGGLLLASRAFTGMANGMSALSGAVVAWQQARPMFRAGSAGVDQTPFMPEPDDAVGEPQARAIPLLDASGIVFRYRGHAEPVLKGVDLVIFPGDRVLLEGPSGGGKSTLASLLVGLRSTESGLLLLNGLDRHTLGGHWHRLATEAPQFHENHILSGTLGFNLLMGRNWPASASELEEAQALCVELGLGELLDRMPSGLMQTVGETGWQLSHGERSRIFLARALLQKSALTVMDESFAALDPETLERCLHCVLRRSRTLLVIAHP